MTVQLFLIFLFTIDVYPHISHQTIHYFQCIDEQFRENHAQVNMFVVFNISSLSSLTFFCIDGKFPQGNKYINLIRE